MNPKRLDLFERWARQYDPANQLGEFPFAGYDRVLDGIATAALRLKPSKILDLGTGTGNLLKRFMGREIECWGTDFSAGMLERARTAFPSVQFQQLDLLTERLPAVLPRDFDCIVTAYVLHEFPLSIKTEILNRYRQCLNRGGRIIIGDIAFETAAQRTTAQAYWGDAWDTDEFYWAADESEPVLASVGFYQTYSQVSSCAGIFTMI